MTVVLQLTFVLSLAWLAWQIVDGIRRRVRDLSGLRRELAAERAVRRRLAPFALTTPEAVLDNQGLRVYLYLDSQLIERLYSQLPDVNIELLSRNVEETVDRKGAFEAGVSGLKSQFGKGAVLTVKEVYEPRFQPERAIRKIETHLTTTNQITLIDVPDSVDTSLLASHLRTFEATTGYVVPPDIRNELERSWERFQLDKGIDHISACREFCVAQGDFEISNDLSGEILLGRRLQFGSKEAHISVICKDKDSTTSAGKAVLVAPSSRRLTCLGRVTSWDNHTLTLLAIAIF
jgi:hypothetical protein